MEEMVDMVSDLYSVGFATTDDVMTIEEAARYLKIGRTKMCQLLASGEVESVYIGRLRRVPLDCLKAYITSLRARAQGNDAA